jgi:S-adenosylmethionine hydrolase
VRLTHPGQDGQGPARGAFAFMGGVAPIVTLTTDFGTRDPFVGLMKVRIHERCPAAHVVDLTHDLPPFRPAVAAFWLERCRRWCPPGTIHVAVVDPGVGTARRLLVAESAGQVFLAPDNGLLGGVLASGGAVVHAIDFARLPAHGLSDPSATFHGRDVLAPLAAELAAGRASPADLGPPVEDWEVSSLPRTVEAADGVHGEVLLVDRYGNAFTNLPGEMAAKGGDVHVGGRRVPVVRTYGDAPPGAAVALANSFGVVEIAVNAGNAAAALGLQPGLPVRFTSA